MSYAGNNRYGYSSRRPMLKRVGTGFRQRVTVETGGDERHSSWQDQARVNRQFAFEGLRTRQRERGRYGGLYSRTDPVVPRKRRESRPFSDEVEPAENKIYAAPPEFHSAHAEDDGDDDYDFDLPKRPKAVTYAGEISFDIPGSDANDNSDRPSQEPKPKFSGPVTELSIACSRWLGNTFDRGDLTGEISTIGSPTESSEKKAEPLMTWYHLERPMMSLEEFQAAALAVLQMPEKEHRDVVKLLRDVQKKFEKQRQYGRDMEPDCVSDVFYHDAKDGSKQTASVVFLSYPYFCLEPYASAQINNLTSGSPLHPLRPMLQAHFNASSQKRELAQAITSISGTPQGNCLHISQVWALVVNGSTTITCSRLSLDALCGENIKKATTSPMERAGHIRVSAGSDRSWLIPVTSSTTWPAILSLFAEQLLSTGDQCASPNLEYNNEGIDGKSWPRVLEAAQRYEVELSIKDPRMYVKDLDRQAAYVPPTPDAGENVDQDASEVQEVAQYAAGADLGGSAIGVQDGNDVPAIVQVEPDSADAESPEIVTRQSKPVEQPLSEIADPSQTLQLFKHADGPPDMTHSANILHETLKSNSRAQERVAYMRCPTSKLADVNNLSALTDDHDGDNTRTEEAVSLIKQKKRIASLARYLFGHFWPTTFEHPITMKFWGALRQLLSRKDEFYIQGHLDPEADLAEASSIYDILHDEVLTVASALSQEFLSYEQDLLPLPEAFSKAWLHLMTAFVLAAQTTFTEKVPFSNSPVSKHLHAVAQEFDTGRKEIMTRLRSTTDLEDLEICSSNSLLALFLSNAASDIMHDHRRPDVATAYNDYFKRLEFNITEDPRPRSHQETLRFFLQEVEAILITLQHQLSVLDAFQQSLEQQSAASAQTLLLYSLGESRQEVVVSNLLARVDGRIDRFKGLQQRAQDLGEWHQAQMQNNKDRQERAIFVFTVVTVIFLPMSFVSSVFGMNTNDVRNMSYDQWAYWAAGVPLTVVVILASLWFAGEFEGVGEWVARSMARSGKGFGGYEKLPEREDAKVYSMPVRRLRREEDAADWERDVEELRSANRAMRRSTYPWEGPYERPPR